MSAEDTLVTREHFDYLAAHAAGDDELLRQLKLAARAAGIPPIWIGAGQAALLAVLLRLCGARRVLEVGTLAGSTAIAMARALPAGGHLSSIELNPTHADFAEAWIARSDVAQRVSVLRGAGAELMAAMPDGSLDAILLDADKSGYPTYMQHARRLLRPGGLFMADNAFAFGQLFDAQPRDPEVEAVRAFNELVPAQDWLEAVIVPLGDGLWVGVVRADPA
ncbi:MAG: methyltransferase [Planctomycetota bacterium]|nr:MAG: methyltransferase [Planctomycetota bacterium]